MLKKYKIKSTEAIFVDDVKKNCIAAKQAWIMSVLAEKPSQVIDDLKKILHI
jgi:FMN phosphatase YigB (HAD superfamily)